MRGYNQIQSLVFFCIIFFLILLFSFGCARNGEGLEENGDDDYSNNNNDTVVPMLKEEKDALYSTIQGFVGKSWNGSDLYPDPCGWTPIQGVSCDNFNGYWYITTITIGPIHDNSLTCNNQQHPQFPPHLFKLTHLKSLTIFNCFSHSNTVTTIPSSTAWESLANTLESLELRSNIALAGSIPTSLTNLKSLVLLNNNRLSGEIPTDIGLGLLRLKKLVISGNRLITGEIPYSIGNLMELLILDLSRNSLYGSIPVSLGQLNDSLLKLDLSGNVLSGSIPREIGRMKKVTLFDVSGNTLTGGLEWIEKMESVEELVLSDNVDLGGEMDSVDQWEIRVPNLVILGLSNVGLSGGLPVEITRLKNMRWLDVSENRMSGEVPTALAEMESIMAVYLNENEFDGVLRFPGWFYQKLGRRFKAERNRNLCYDKGSGRDYNEEEVVAGVKRCRGSEITRELKSLTKVLGGVEDGGHGGGDGRQLVLTVDGRSKRTSSSGGVSGLGIWRWSLMVGSLMGVLVMDSFLG